MHLIPFFLVLAVIARLWWDLVGAKWRARSAAQHACSKADMIFLDELGLSSWRIHWHQGARVHRSYGFEFCADGPQRYHGQVDMVGSRVTGVQLDPYPIQ